jgi:hypothetical protein
VAASKFGLSFARGPIGRCVLPVAGDLRGGTKKREPQRVEIDILPIRAIGDADGREGDAVGVALLVGWV